MTPICGASISSGIDKLIDIFCNVDDFCKVFIPQWEKQLIADGSKKRNCKGRMSISEIMTIIICSHHRDFKNCYKGYITLFLKNEFHQLLSYTSFLEVFHNALIPLYSYFTTLRGKPADIDFVESTSISVCHNLRIPRHKTFDAIAKKGKEQWVGSSVLNFI